MAYISYDNLWRIEFHNNVSAKDKVQDNTFNQLKLKVNDSYENDEKITAKIEAVTDEDIINKAYLDTTLTKIEDQISFIEKSYNNFKLNNTKQYVEEILIESTFEKTIQNFTK